MCKECIRHEDEDNELDFSNIEPGNPAEEHDRAYNGDELPDVDYD